MAMDRRTALVTGASSGIGSVFAQRLVARGADVVLVARRGDRLDALATRPSDAYGVTATALGADLVQPGAAEALAEELSRRGTTNDVLVNNAGFATHGEFVAEDPALIADEIALNVATVVGLTRALLPGMVDRGRGLVLNVASTAAFQPVPYMAVHGATKAFVLSFTEALYGELAGSGVRALSLCPGGTQTEFFDVAGDAAGVGRRQTPEQVVDTALRELDRRSPQPSVVSGRGNALSARLPRVVPRRTTIAITRRLMAANA